MPTPARKDAIHKDHIYHIIARGNDKQQLFFDDYDYRLYLRLLDKSKQKNCVSVLNYCLMPNHVHMLVRPETDDLSKFMYFIQRHYALHFNFKHGRVGHVWQGRFKSLLVETDAYYQVCAEYIQENPIRAGLCSNPTDWPYSS